MKDTQIEKLIKLEERRQKEGLEMIPSENYASRDVLRAMSSILNDKYSEGYPGKRYYAGNEFIDQIETLAQNRAKKIFRVAHANVQPYSGSPANFAVLTAVCAPGDTIMGLNLPDGGHLTHGWKASATSKFFKSIPYHVRPDGKIDMAEVRSLALEHKPKLIWVGATAYPYKYNYAAFAKIADEVGAYFAADIAHVAGLIAAGAHPSPTPHAHILTTTTHKTLRGPRGAIIMVTARGLKKDPELANKIDQAIFPGLQGGPHDHQTAAIAIALNEASTPAFRKYGAQIVKNMAALTTELKHRKLKVIGGTENHMALLDLIPIFGPGGGLFAQEALELAGITVNKNTIPRDPSTPFYPSGVRIGTPALTTRGMKEKEMKHVGRWLTEALYSISEWNMPVQSADKNARLETIKKFRASLPMNKTLSRIHREIRTFTRGYPVPGI